MAAERLARAVRSQLGLGRLLPLGAAADGTWIAERAAAQVLRAAAGAVGGVRMETLRLSLADPSTAAPPAVPPPPSALPYGPLRLEAGFAALPDEPLPQLADRLRAVLSRVAAERLGAADVAVDLHVTALLDGPPEGTGAGSATAASGRGPEPDPAERDPGLEGPPDDLAGRAARTAAAVPGVARLAPALGLPPATRAVRITGHAGGDRNGNGDTGRGGDAHGAASRLHAQIQLAVTPGHRVLDVARAVRAAVAATADGDEAGAMTVAVLVTAVDPD